LVDDGSIVAVAARFDARAGAPQTLQRRNINGTFRVALHCSCIVSPLRSTQ